MTRNDELDLAIGPMVDLILKKYDKWIANCLRDYADGENYATWRAVWRTMRKEHDDGRMRVRVHRYIRANVIVNGMPNKALFDSMSNVMDPVTEQYQHEVIEAVMGRHHIPAGIEHMDMWLAPASEMQKMLTEREGDGAVYVVQAMRNAEGELDVAYFWTENEELIEEAKAGHRKYQALLAREMDGRHRKGEE